MSTRREFLQASGALVLAFSWSDSFGQAKPALPGSLATNRMLDGWLRIDGVGVTIFSGKIELGQGIGTALTQIAADELDVDLKRINIIHGDTALTPNEGQTAGSLSVQTSGTAVRYACAEARQMLLVAAASRLGAPVDLLKVTDGTITSPNGASLSYWSLAHEINLHKEASGSARPKPPAAHKWVGKSIPRRDIPKKFTGGQAYVQDLRMPGMLYGRVVRPPSPGATLVSVNEKAVREMIGVTTVMRDGNFLAVAAEREEQAVKARLALAKSAVWKESATLPPQGKALYDHMVGLGVPAQVMLEKTGPSAPAAKKLEARYTRPFQLHGSIGPSCAVARWTDGQLHVWTHSQGVYPLRGDLANVFNLRATDVRCTHVEGSGCYGHNGADDVALDAALLARGTGGRAVKLQWMRDDEFMWEPYGSAMVMQLGAALDASGNLVSWSHELWSHPHSRRPGQSKGSHTLAARWLAEPRGAEPVGDVPLPAGGSDRNAIPGAYDIPNVKVSKHFIVDSALRTSALRTLGAYANVFALESFMDELAASAGADPVEFRLRHIRDPRARAVVEATAAKAGWKPKQKGDGSRGWGFAYARYKNIGCYCAVAAQVAVERKTGLVRVLRAVSAVDVGQAVNPDGVVNQIEGGIIQSTSWTLKEAVSFDRTRVKTRSWADYPILRFQEVPQVEVALLDQPDQGFLGVGEGSQGPTGAAIANAVANATGRRLRDLPLTPARVKAALV